MEASMAEIVMMNTWRDRPGRKSQSGQPQGERGASGSMMVGQVVLFTGVRYERFDDRMDRKAENHSPRFEQN
jgi:hypothetical protein